MTLKSVSPCKVSMKFCSPIGICGSCLFQSAVTAKFVLYAATPNDCAVTAPICVNTLNAEFVVLVNFSIQHVLSVSAYPKIFPAVVQRIAVDVVNLFASLCPGDDPMQQLMLPFPALFEVANGIAMVVDRPAGIKQPNILV